MAVIKKIKKFFTNETIYPVSTSQAIYDTDSGERLDNILKRNLAVTTEDVGEIEDIDNSVDKIGDYTIKDFDELFAKVDDTADKIENYTKEDMNELFEKVSDDNIANSMDEINSGTTKKFAGVNALKELFQYVSNKKTELASIATDKNVPTDATSTFDVIIANLRKIKLGKGTAVKSDVLAGKTFTNDDGEEYEGTMVNNGAVKSSLNCGKTYTIPQGYHDGNGVITANSLASQTSGTAVSKDIVSDKTAYVNGKKVTGTLWDHRDDKFGPLGKRGYNNSHYRIQMGTSGVFSENTILELLDTNCCINSLNSVYAIVNNESQENTELKSLIAYTDCPCTIHKKDNVLQVGYLDSDLNYTLEIFGEIEESRVSGGWGDAKGSTVTVYKNGVEFKTVDAEYYAGSSFRFGIPVVQDDTISFKVKFLQDMAHLPAAYIAVTFTTNYDS